MSAVLSSLTVYPVKSLAGYELRRCRARSRGLQHDRLWMLVDNNGRFLSQRTCPGLALIAAQVTADGLVLSASGRAALTVATPAADGKTESEVVIWEDTVRALTADASAHDWLSECMGQRCRLVYLPPTSIRPVTKEYARPQDEVSFADGFPYLLISSGSLDELNCRLERPVDVRRFRPNLVISGTEPFAEDAWQRLRIGQVVFRVAKPCSRCRVVTVDPDTGRFDDEPLRTLVGYRSREGGVMFGVNLIAENEGELLCGDPVQVLA